MIMIETRTDEVNQCLLFLSFFFSEIQKQKDVENMIKLFELSQEYMLNGVEQMIRQELINKSRSAVLSKDVKFSTDLLILADDICCEEAINLCLILISGRLEIFSPPYYTSKQKDWKHLVEGNTLSGKTRTKLLGFVLKKKIEESKKIEPDDSGRRSENTEAMSEIANTLINFKELKIVI